MRHQALSATIPHANVEFLEIAFIILIVLILISTFWGDEPKEYILSVDNHAQFALYDDLMDTLFEFLYKINNAKVLSQVIYLHLNYINT